MKLSHFITLIACIFLTACSSNKVDLSLQPAELTTITDELAIKTQWDRSLGKSAKAQDVVLEPAIANGAVFTTDISGKVYKVNHSSGAIVWQQELDTNISSGVGVDKYHAYVGTSEGYIQALSVQDGKPVWRTQLSSQSLVPVASNNNIVVVHTADGRLTGLDAITGQKKWEYFGPSNSALTLHGGSAPIISRDMVFVGQANGRIATVNIYTGVEQWQHAVTYARGRGELARLVDINGRVLIDDGILYAVSYQGKISAVDLNRGEKLWDRTMSSYRSLASDYQAVYVSDADGVVWALDKSSGRPLWKQAALLHRKLSAPQVYENKVVVGDAQGYLHFLSTEDGHIQARVKPDSSPIVAQPLVDDDVLYVYSKAGRVAALTLAATTS